MLLHNAFIYKGNFFYGNLIMTWFGIVTGLTEVNFQQIFHNKSFIINKLLKN